MSRILALLFLLIILVISFVFSLSIGSVHIDFLEVWQVFFQKLFGITGDVKATTEAIIWQIRFPRAVLAMLIGALLSLSGVGFQAVLRNPLADPYILGVSSGAGLGAALIILLGWQYILSNLAISLNAFIFSLITLVLVLFLAQQEGRLRNSSLILAGVIVQSFAAALISLIITFSEDKMLSIIYWLMGSLALRNDFFLPTLMLTLVITFFTLLVLNRELDILALGEDNATYLGVNVVKKKKLILVISSFAASFSVAVTGIIGFVGLVIPHITRLIFGPNHRYLITYSMIIGSIFLLWADLLARTILAPQELPIGVITAFLGAPFFAYLLKKERATYW